MNEPAAANRIRSQADVDRALLSLRRIDPRLSPVIDAVERDGPVPLRWAPQGFAGLAQIVTGQQVSRHAASAIFERVGRIVAPLDEPTWLATDPETLRAAGLSRAKVDTLARIAQATLDYRAIAAMDAKAAERTLVAIKGVGPWTAQVWLLFCAGHPDIFPVGDLALRVGLGDIVGEARPDERRAARIVEAWRPHRSVAARLVWAHYARLKGWSAQPV